jgi:hypothetical protein
VMSIGGHIRSHHRRARKTDAAAAGEPAQEPPAPKTQAAQEEP